MPEKNCKKIKLFSIDFGEVHFAAAFCILHFLFSTKLDSKLQRVYVARSRRPALGRRSGAVVEPRLPRLRHPAL
jgi:hypothetical protein